MFSEIEQPFICTIITDKKPADCKRTIWLSDFDGTDAYQWHLMMLEKEHLNETSLRPIFESTGKPIIVSFYRWDCEKRLDIDENQRIRLLLDTFRWGGNGIDLEADAFDPTPGPAEWSKEVREYSLNSSSKIGEWTMNHETIKRQKEVIEDIPS